MYVPMDGWMVGFMYMYVRSYQHQKVNLHSLMRTQWPIFVQLGMWVVGEHKYYSRGLSWPMHISNTSFAYLFWLANYKKKVKYPELCMGYIDETWYVGSDGHKYYPCGLSSPNVHIRSDWLITTKKNQISRVLYGLHWWNDETYYVGSDGHKLPKWSVVIKCTCLIPYLHICSNWLITKNQICNNWYAHVKSDLRSLPTYAHQRRPTLYILWI